jgi:hypothetical protein
MDQVHVEIPLLSGVVVVHHRPSARGGGPLDPQRVPRKHDRLVPNAVMIPIADGAPAE